MHAPSRKRAQSEDVLAAIAAKDAEAARAAAAAPARSAQNPPPQGNATQKKSEKGKLKQCPELQLLPLHSEE